MSHDNAHALHETAPAHRTDQPSRTVPIGVSNRHIHLSARDLDILFGPGYTLHILRPLSQPGQFAAEETVTVVGPKGAIHHVRILGPVRKETQIEISRTDAHTLGIDAPLRLSGDIAGTPGARVIGPQGELHLERGVIIAKRHIHFHPDDAERFGVRDHDVVRVAVGTSGERGLVFDDVIARVHPTFALDFHIDVDEANAAGVKTGDVGRVLLS
ncbi:MAG: Ethanolamine utilization protein similar to PduL [Candidatus Carbobacillus altaicus]|uniref:Phosphate propanoyltransferase n=1 Tax=Candidatus Carbonibacillus altaicus TaxID=2163959 RepID=A0A2R6Y2E3_9BACL|nr:MAG: Ethanolamine utilization protein similar to PduL [Candidatus Carbobacillus altaicus]